MTGFYIAKVRVYGKGLPPADVGFTRGCNLIVGASDTGKSYIFSLINYGFGKKETPKEFNESVGYEGLIIQIQKFDDDSKIYSLHRKFKEDVITVKECPLDIFFTSNEQSFPYKTTGDVSSTQNISNFLLSLCDLEGKKVLKSKSKGKTENFSFASLRKLFWISEVGIVTESSPFYFSGSHSTYTKDQSVLKILLSGEDFSSIVPREEKLIKETRIGGKIDFIINQVNLFSADRAKLAAEKMTRVLRGEVNLDALKKQLRLDLEELDSVNATLSELHTQKSKLFNELIYNDELIKRFNTLEKQYQSDGERIDFIMEADTLSSQLGDSVCPICSSPLNSDTLAHITEMDSFRVAAQNELQKIKTKLADLQETIFNLLEERATHQSQLENVQEKIDDLNRRSITLLTPRIQDTTKLLDSVLSNAEISARIKFVDDEIEKLYKEQDRLQKLLKAKADDEEISVVDYTLLAELSEYIEDRLKRWKYETDVSITFNSHYSVFDVVISGKARKSYGKGKRAISYAACILGLLDYCLAKGLPCQNLVLLDSPLTTFEEKKTNGSSELNDAVQDAFFEDLVKTPLNCQVIIFDNKEPKPSVLSQFNHHLFTGNRVNGRQGFYPPK